LDFLVAGLFVIMMEYACVISAWIHGDARKVVYPTDSNGHFCGQQNTLNANKAILFYFNMLKCANPAVLINLQCPTTQLCVSKCPDRFATLLDARNTKSWEYYEQFCKPGFKIGRKSIAEVIRDEDCPAMIVPSRPSKRDGILTVANQTIFKDGNNHKRMYVFVCCRGFVIAMVVSLLFILLLRFTAGVLLWLLIFGVITAVAYGIWHCYWEYSSLSGTPGSNVTIPEIWIQADLKIYLQQRQLWLIFSTIATVVFVAVFIHTTFMFTFNLILRAIGYIMSTLFYPLVTFFLLAICTAFSAVTAVFLASSGNAVYKVTSVDDKCVYANITCNPETFIQTNVTNVCPGSQCMFAFYGGETAYHRYILLLHLCNLFVFIWLTNFTIALGQCTLAGAFASYYWALNKPHDIPLCPLYASFSRAIRYHTGSLAFGSLILSVVQMIRIALDYLDHKLKGSHNACARFMLCCLKCCFWCLECFIKFINRNGYIMIAIYGKNFCTSSKDAFFLLMRNVLRVAVLDRVTDFLLFLGKLLIAGSVGTLAFFFFSGELPVLQAEVPSLNYPWVPILTVIFGSYMIANGFFNVFTMCVDTLFLCFCEDLERNDGSSSRPYYMSPGLHKILRKQEEATTSSVAS
uniref:Choline transporter-like protein n=1 Tax=Gouania willdenowi TaxID=441366 RepID=A0A8C5D9J1_GOUWI